MKRIDTVQMTTRVGSVRSIKNSSKSKDRERTPRKNSKSKETTLEIDRYVQHVETNVGNWIIGINKS